MKLQILIRTLKETNRMLERTRWEQTLHQMTREKK